MTTKRWYDIMKDIKFKMYIPNWRLGFIVNNKLYKVQVGAYSIKSNAENMLVELQKKGFNGIIVETERN